MRGAAALLRAPHPVSSGVTSGASSSHPGSRYFGHDPKFIPIGEGTNIDLGGTGKTLLFEGEPDHLVPAASEAFVESDLFWVAGWMFSHSFLHFGLFENWQR
ncbi:hypothetical protein AMECASPLE_031369 [Ameca splendens]|uniref:Uncharacterized protein n=1 Tax=Ameca splendens TaxID=208324 RepID=A0ABV0XJ87_9TELE